MNAVRTPQVLGERQSVIMGQAPALLCVLDAGEPGETVIWLPPTAGAGRVEGAQQKIDADGSIQADFVPYAVGESEVVCMVGGNPARTHTFRVTTEPNPKATTTVRPSMAGCPVPRSWVSEIPPPPGQFSDSEIDELFEPLTRTSVRPSALTTPMDEPLREALPPPAMPAAMAARPPLADLVEFAPTAPPPRVIGAAIPQEPPLTPAERKSIAGGRGNRILRSWPMLGIITAVVMALCLSVVGVLSSQMMDDKEALEEVTRRDARLHREARTISKAKASAPADTIDRETVVDFNCSNAPIRRNADGTYTMDVCID